MYFTLQSLSLANGDQLTLSSNVKLLFETDDLAKATPAVVARSVSIHQPSLSHK